MKIVAHLVLITAAMVACIPLTHSEISKNIRPSEIGDRLGKEGSIKQKEGAAEESLGVEWAGIADSRTNEGTNRSSVDVNESNAQDWYDIPDAVRPPVESPEEEAEKSPKQALESEKDEDSIAERMEDWVVDDAEGRFGTDNVEVEEGVGWEDESDDMDGSGLLTSTHKKSNERLRNVRKVRVFVASKTTVGVWRNFKAVGNSKTWKNAVELRLKARVGDSITLISKGRKRHFGIAAMIHDGRNHWFRTGGRGGRAFKAIELTALKKKMKPDLRRPGRKMCYLRYPYIVTPQRGRGIRYARNGKAKVLYRYGAQYVWARSASYRAKIGVRFVVGGVRCKRPRPSKKPSPSPKVGIVARCACRAVRTGSKGECFEFRNKRFSELANKVAPCRRGVCGLKYECVQPGSRSRIVCVRRFARYDVRSIGPVFKGKCRNVPLRSAQPYYAPYS